MNQIIQCNECSFRGSRLDFINQDECPKCGSDDNFVLAQVRDI